VSARCRYIWTTYLTKMYVDEWMAANMLLTHEPPAHSIGDLIRLRGPRKLVTITPKATAEDAIQLMQTRGISQLPVLDNGKPVGGVQEVTLARVLHDHGDPTKVSVNDIMARPLPQVETTVHLDEAYRLLLAGYTGVLAVQD